MKRLIGYERGVNFGGWYSHEMYDKEHQETFITEKDFARVASWGLDHIRLTVDYNIFEDESGNYKEDGFEHVARAIALCKKYGLNMILDLHKAAGFSYEVTYKETGLFDSPALQERFCALWEQFAKRFGKEPNVAFELLNEVTEPSYIDSWNAIAEAAVKRIRAYAPEIKIFIGSYWNNSVDAVKDLAMPYDENIVYNFHCYDPFMFTHQAAYWVQQMKPEFRIDYPGNIEDYRKSIKEYGLEFMQTYDHVEKFDTDYFMDRFRGAVQVCEERGVALYCGEYGAISHADNASILRWYKDINAAFENYGIARAAWSYHEMDFGIGDPDKDDIIDELIKYL